MIAVSILIMSAGTITSVSGIDMTTDVNHTVKDYSNLLQLITLVGFVFSGKPHQS